MTGEHIERAFQVDLRGVVDLLSHNLYSSPRVYLRELLQNAVDAITARRQLDAAAPAVVRIESLTSGHFTIADSGVGLTEADVHDLLATIGRSSKRDDLGFARSDFLGQFGIGLLSCFMVADEIRVISRSARGGGTVEWRGFADGRYRVAPAEHELTVPGTVVQLTPRAGMSDWLSTEQVTWLAQHYGALLPTEITVDGRPVGDGPPLWQREFSSPTDRRDALDAYCERTFGFRPLDVVELAVAQAGLTGVGFVLPMPANPAERGGHRVYLRRMLLAEDVRELLPEWGFFVRCVVDVAELRPTASREGLYENDLLYETRDALGGQIREWLLRLSATDPARLQDFLLIHHLGVKALAVHDTAMLRIVDQWWPMETNLGPLPLASIRARNRVIRYTTTADEFRELGGVAIAQGMVLVNGGYAYDIDIMNRIGVLDPTVSVRPLQPDELTAAFAAPDGAASVRLRPFLSAAENVLRPQGCAVVARSFDPPDLPALYLVSREAVRSAEMRSARAGVDDLWSGILGHFDGGDARPQLVLNLRNPVVQKVIGLTQPDLRVLGVQSLYGQALLQGHHPIGARDSALLNSAVLGLLTWATS